ncbi:MAG TPA: ornithine cyclodeaminase family protein [Pseudonocardia sp.]|nr:ornithine cyclodeaminase family protein [Pseudonocardia sp.]
MPELVVLTRADVESLLDVDALLPALGEAFQQLSKGAASAPPRVGVYTATGALAAMPAYVPGTALSTKLVAVNPANPGRGLPSHQAMIVVFDEETGTALALMDGTHITAARTGAAAAVAADAVARPDSRVLAILGAGVQGRSHLAAFPRIRDFTEIRIASRTAAHAEELAAQHPAAQAVATFEEAVTGADVVCCCTDAREPVLQAAWLAPGAHVSSVGGTFGPELDPAVVAAGRVFVEWRGAVENAPPAGAHELQGLDPATVTEVGEVLSGARAGRASATELTVYKSTGHAVEDAAAARLVLDRARQTGRGTRLTL